MNKEYFNRLVNQYKQTLGITKVDIESESFLKSFNTWLKERKKIGNKYLDFLYNMNLDIIETMDAIEVGKGKDDSIVKKLCTTIITPYSEGLERLGSRVITSGFKVYNGIPTLVRTLNDGKVLKTPITDIDEAVYMTQNPYNSMFTLNWDQLHNYNTGNIIVGIYGSIHDKDIVEKRDRLVALKNKLIRPYKEDFEIDNDTYYYAIASDILERTYR